MPPNKPATIIDVAREAGVSIKTVSRVLNQEPGVHSETREAVLKVVAELKYRPKQSARSLAGGRSFLIGLLYYDPSAAFVGGVQQGATLRCREAGYHLVVESLHNDAPDLAIAGRSHGVGAAARRHDPDPAAVRQPSGAGRAAREPDALRADLARPPTTPTIPACAWTTSTPRRRSPIC